MKILVVEPLAAPYEKEIEGVNPRRKNPAKRINNFNFL